MRKSARGHRFNLSILLTFSSCSILLLWFYNVRQLHEANYYSSLYLYVFNISLFSPHESFCLGKKKSIFLSQNIFKFAKFFLERRKRSYLFSWVNSLSIWFSVSFFRKLFFTVFNHMALLILLILCVLLSHNIKPALHLFQNIFLMQLNLESRRALDWVIHALHLEGHWRIHWNTPAFFRDVLNYLGPQKGLTRREMSMCHKANNVSLICRTDTWHHFSPQHNFRIRYIGSIFLEWKIFSTATRIRALRDVCKNSCCENHLSLQSMGVLTINLSTSN